LHYSASRDNEANSTLKNLFYGHDRNANHTFKQHQNTEGKNKKRPKSQLIPAPQTIFDARFVTPFTLEQ